MGFLLSIFLAGLGSNAMSNITVVGIGYVGLANALLLAQNNTVSVYDISCEKISLIKKRISPIHDKEVEEYLQNPQVELIASNNKESAYKSADFIIIATPTDYETDRNFFNTSSVESVINDIEKISPDSAIIIKSTVPVGFTEKMRKEHPSLMIIFSPEFLREGKALYDNLYPSRIIIGDTTQKAFEFGGLLLQGAKKKETPVLYMLPTEAEAVKLFSNTFLALRVAYFNELDTYAEIYGLDTKSIITGMCLDPRIGNYYNNPSFGYGGYCLPKDSKQLKANYKNIPNNLISAVVEANKTRKEHIAAMIIAKKPNVVGVYKLEMKSGSDNLRDSAVLGVLELLRKRGIKVIIFDPLISVNKIDRFKVMRNFDEFVQISDIIITNRFTNELEGVKYKVYTRDIFLRD
jgi:UDPglucose 6-dehydrogenase